MGARILFYFKIIYFLVSDRYCVIFSYFSVRPVDTFLCHEDIEVDNETGGPESTAETVYTSEQGTAGALITKEQMCS